MYSITNTAQGNISDVIGHVPTTGLSLAKALYLAKRASTALGLVIWIKRGDHIVTRVG